MPWELLFMILIYFNCLKIYIINLLITCAFFFVLQFSDFIIVLLFLYLLLVHYLFHHDNLLVNISSTFIYLSHFLQEMEKKNLFQLVNYLKVEYAVNFLSLITRFDW